MAIFSNYWKTRVVHYPVLALCAVAACITTGLDQGLTKSDWASWVQAVGSIAAIFGTAWIAFMQLRREDHRSRAAELQREIAFARVLIQLLQQSIEKAGAVEGYAHDHDRIRMRTCAAGFDAVRTPVETVLAQATSTELIEAAAFLHAALTDMSASIARATETLSVVEMVMCEIMHKGYVDQLGATLRRVREVLDEMLMRSNR